MTEFTATYRVHIYEVDSFGELTTAGTIRFLQQTASDATTAIGFPLDWYDRRGTVWLIRRTTFERLAPAVYDDALVVRTWVTDMRRVRSERAYEMTRRRDGALIGRATTDWVYVDIARGLPTRVPHELQAALMPRGITAQARRPGAWQPPPSAAHFTVRRVELAHLDSVAHVNNAKYADFLEQDFFDALTAHRWTIDPSARNGRLRLQGLDLEYFSPALLENRIDGSVWVTAVDGPRIACGHRLRHEDRDVVCARTVWEWSAGAPPDALLRAARQLSESTLL
jgi:acyl-CoA thioester hydrolase